MTPVAAVILKFLAKFLKGLVWTVPGGLVGLTILIHMLLANPRRCCRPIEKHRSRFYVEQ
jgi:hypothetical protein